MQNILEVRVSKEIQLKSIVTLLFAISVIISLLSFTNLTAGIGGIYLAKYLTYFSFVGLLIVYLKDDLIKIKKSHLIIISIGFVLSSISLFNAGMASAVSSTFLIAVTMLIYISAILLFQKVPEKLFENLLNALFFSISILVIIPSFIYTFDASSYYLIGDRFRFTGIFNNPNELARFSAIGFVIAIRLWSMKSKFAKLMLLGIMAMALYVIEATDSRAALLLCVIAVAFLVLNWTLLKIGKKRLGILVAFALPVAVFAGLIYVLLLPSGVSFNLDNLTSGRISIWQSVFANMNLSELLFGNGSGRKGLEATAILTNGYVEVITYFGLIGLFFCLSLIVLLLVKKYKVAVKNKSLSSMQGVAIIVAFLVYFVFEGGIISIGNIAGIYFWLELSQRKV